jgi:xanthine dehydrogenase small subunit
MGAIKLRLEGGTVAGARIAFGGMAGTPKRAKRTEAGLIGIAIADEAAIADALVAMRDDFTPLDDMRASAAYRLDVACALITKAIAEIAGTPSTATRVFGRRSDAHAA